MFDPFVDNHIVPLGQFQLVMYDGWYGHIEDRHEGEDYSLNIGVGHIVEDGETWQNVTFARSDKLASNSADFFRDLGKKASEEKSATKKLPPMAIKTPKLASKKCAVRSRQAGVSKQDAIVPGRRVESRPKPSSTGPWDCATDAQSKAAAPIGSHGVPMASVDGPIQQSTAGEGDTSSLKVAPWSVNGADAWHDLPQHAGKGEGQGNSEFGE